MNKLELTKAIDNLDWIKIQSDCPIAYEQLDSLRDKLKNLSQDEAIKILLAVIEAKSLPDDFCIEHGSMHDFKYLFD